MPLTATAWQNFKLRQGTREPGSFRVGRGGGAAVLTGIIPGEDLETILQEGVETATADNSTGAIHRILPVAHPKRAWMFLRNVDNVQGIQFVEKLDADPDGYLEVPPIPFSAEYAEYEVTATFEPRPYGLLDDASIPSYTIDYFDETGAPQTKAAFKEWWRYTEWLQSPAAEVLTADKGQYKFANPGVAVFDPDLGPADNSSAGPGQIRHLIPGATWRVKWFCVPYQYVLSDKSYFNKYLGHVNQQSIWGLLPGQGLFQAINVLDVYSPPFPDFTTYDGYESVSQDKLCDLELIFATNDRVAKADVVPTNQSHVIHGHNTVLHSGSNKFFYVESIRFTLDAPGLGDPIYTSAPFDILFQNPDGP